MHSIHKQERGKKKKGTLRNSSVKTVEVAIKLHSIVDTRAILTYKY